VTDWHGLIGHATYADAILDRLVHNARRIELSGDSMRRPKHPSRVQRLGEHAKINPK
jgi:DNA replication protein DnaC